MKNDYFINRNHLRKSLNEFSITTINVNRVLLSFIFYSFVGWIIETFFILFLVHRLILETLHNNARKSIPRRTCLFAGRFDNRFVLEYRDSF